MHAQKPSDLATMKDRLQHASADTSIDTAGTLPWHLKLDVQLLATPTQKAEQGTIEAWWQSPETYRIAYALPSYTAVLLHTPAGQLRTREQDSPPELLETLLAQAVHPVEDEPLNLVTPEARQKKFGKTALDCIMLSKPMKPNGDSRMHVSAPSPLGLFPTYCFDAGSPVLRVSFNLGSQAVIRNGVGTFQKRSVATSTTIYEGPTQVATSHITMLRGEAPPAGTYEPSPDLADPDKAAVLLPGVVAGAVLHKTIPVYPESAKESHIAGTVILHVIIGRDGHVHRMRLVSAPDGDLALSALDAVRSWTYKPYLLNGKPTEVDSTISVNYAFGN